MSPQATERLEIKKLSLPPYDNNCYILTDRQSQECVIIDAPSEPDRILAAAAGTHIRRILITHNHADHWGALKELKQRTGALVSAHPSDAGALPVAVDAPVEHGDVVEFGQVQAQVIHTPGHTPGSLCLLVGRFLFTGDTLFPDGPGHTRTPADLEQIIHSITQRLFVLPDDTVVHPGHGADSVLGREKQEYVVFAARPRDPNLCGDVVWRGS